MDKLGQIIRNTLNSKRMSSTDLGQMTGLSSKTIDNVIYGKSRKESLLKIISTALGIDITQYQNNIEQDIELLQTEINLQLYSLSSNTVITCIQKNNVLCNKEQLDLLIITLYNFLVKNQTFDTYNAEIFCLGMIEYGIKNFLLNYKNHESIEIKE